VIRNVFGQRSTLDEPKYRPKQSKGNLSRCRDQAREPHERRVEGQDREKDNQQDAADGRAERR